MRGDVIVIPSESKLTHYFLSNCVICKLAVLVSHSSFFAMMHLRLLSISFCLVNVFRLFLCRVQFARSDVQREGSGQTVLRNASATTGAGVTPKLDSASVLKVSLVTGVYVKVFYVAAFDCPCAWGHPISPVMPRDVFFLHCKRRNKTQNLVLKFWRNVG